MPLIAETGGQNAMIVDSSALAEQAVADVIVSAFDSAGQRCSALRVLCIQEDVADRVLTMLRGAMDELRVGEPTMLCGRRRPDDRRRCAQRRSARTSNRMQAPGIGCIAARSADGVERRADGTFVAPALIEIGAIGELQREVFGPVLHVLRYRRETLGKLVDDINATGYGLTLGIHSRIDETIDRVVARARAGQHLRQSQRHRRGRRRAAVRRRRVVGHRARRRAARCIFAACWRRRSTRPAIARTMRCDRRRARMSRRCSPRCATGAFDKASLRT